MTYKIIDGKILSFVVSILLLSILFGGTASAATLTVDDSGGADYTRIQNAINNANNGDTILVHTGTYYEKIVVDKQLILQGVDDGEGKPVVNAGGSGNVITISYDGVTLDGFLVTNGTIGIYVISNNNNVRNNVAEYNTGIRGIDSNTGSGGDGGNVHGIFLLTSNKNNLTDNIVQYNTGGAGGNTLSEWDYNGVPGNGGNSYGIYLTTSSDNLLSGNIIKYNSGGNSGLGPYGMGHKDLGDGGKIHGIYINASSNNTLTSNIIENNRGGNSVSQSLWGSNGNGGDSYGIYLKNSIYNNLIENIVDDNLGGDFAINYWPGKNGNSYGIYLDTSYNNIFTSNIFQNNRAITGNSGSGNGIYLIHSSDNIFTKNTVEKNNGGNGRYLDLSGFHAGDSNGIYLVYSDNNIFQDNIIHNHTAGNGPSGVPGGNSYSIRLSFSLGNMFKKNTVEHAIGGTGAPPNPRYRPRYPVPHVDPNGNGYGIYLSNSNGNSFEGNNNQHNNKGYGIYISASANNNIYNNYFNNSNNYYVDASYNKWNITKTSARNILNGPYQGGNYWANPQGTGFSQTCTVTYIDGICDSPYILNENNIDYMPLSEDFAPDAIPPVTSIDFLGELGNNNWYVSDVKVILNATDNDGGLGVKDTEFSVDGTNWNTYTTPFTITGEEITTIYYKSTDNIGNIEQVKNQTVKIDKTPPTITGITSTSPNAKGWYNTDVTVSFTASDEISGIDTITPDTIITTEGINQSITGIAVDMAGNSASTTISGINIDKTLPEITIHSPLNEAEYLLNQFLISNWSAIDAVSGLASASGTLQIGEQIDTSEVGLKIFNVTATDNADNTAIKNSIFRVVYDFSGILPPVKEDGSSVFKSGRTVPVKFSIADADGNPVTDASATLAFRSINDDGSLGDEVEAIPTSSASEGNTFRYDTEDDLYIFNLGTDGMEAGTYQLNINLDDGTVKTVQVSIK